MHGYMILLFLLSSNGTTGSVRKFVNLVCNINNLYIQEVPGFSSPITLIEYPDLWKTKGSLTSCKFPNGIIISQNSVT